MAIWPFTVVCVGGDLKKRKGNGGIMRHDVASATQTVKSEKRGLGGGGGRRNLVWNGQGRPIWAGLSLYLCPKGNYVCALKATTYWYATNSQNHPKLWWKCWLFVSNLLTNLVPLQCNTSWRIMEDFSLKKIKKINKAHRKSLKFYWKWFFTKNKKGNQIRTWAVRTLVFLPWSDTTTTTPQTEKTEFSIMLINFPS